MTPGFFLFPWPDPQRAVEEAEMDGSWPGLLEIAYLRKFFILGAAECEKGITRWLMGANVLQSCRRMLRITCDCVRPL